MFVYKFDPVKGSLALNNPAFASVPPGAGPRHFAFHPDGRHAFATDEMRRRHHGLQLGQRQGRADALPDNLDPAAGLSGASTLPPRWWSRSPDGSCTAPTAATTALSSSRLTRPAASSISSSGWADGVKVPRNYAIDPSGKWLVCANLAASTATVYRVDQETGRLSLTGSISVPESLCVRFLQM